MAEPNTSLPPGATLVSGTVPDQQASSGGLPPGATLVSGDVPAPGTTGVVGFLNKIGEGGAEAASDIYGVVKPMAERALMNSNPVTAGIQMVKDAPAAAKTVWDNLPPVQLVNSVQQILPLVDTYEKARSKGAPISDAIRAVNDAAQQHSDNLQKLQPIVDAFRQNPTRETARAVLDASALAASFLVGAGETGAPEEAVASAITKEAPVAAAPAAEAPSLMTRLTNPFKKLLTTPTEAGAAATQEPAAAAVRTAVGAPASAPILEGQTSIVDDLLAKTGVQKDVAYKRIDDTVGFDLKALKQKVADTRYALKQPGADVEKLQTELDSNINQIAEANKKLVKAGINPKEADQLNTAWEATKGLKNDIVKSTSSDGTINVKQLLNRSKNARFNPRYGDRLAQAFGKGDAQAGKVIADEYVRGLEAAQKAGVDAFRAQRFKLWLTGLVGGAAAGTGTVEGLKALLAP